MTDFGAPEWLAAPLGYCLPFLEISVAGLLLPARTALWGALGSLALLVAFVASIAVNMARGKRPDCHCFGQLHSEPIGPSTLLRNGFLAVFAGAFLWQAQPGLGLSAAMNMIFSGHALIAIFASGFALAIAAQGYLTFHLFRQNGRLLLRIEALESGSGNVARLAGYAQSGLPIGSPAPGFELPLARGGTGSLEGLRKLSKPVLLVFSDAACGPCNALMPELTRWQGEHCQQLTFAVITRGVSKDKRAAQPGLDHVFIQNDNEVAQQYRVPGTPSAVLVGPEGLVASAPATGAQAIGELISAAVTGNLPAAPKGWLASQAMSNGLPIGSPSPPLALPDLTGKTVRLADFQGSETMLLFWNPACGFCARMLPDLKKLEGARARNGPSIVLISTGTPEQNRSMGLRSPVLLDEAQGAMRLFGATGTPSGLLIDAVGNIGSSLALGADAVLALADGPRALVAVVPETALVGSNGN
jgi:peroxiredoxin